jgi:hypothetical protein
MAKFFYVLLTFINLTLSCGAIYFIGSRGFVPATGWSAVEVVTVVLAALAVLITVLGIFVAGLAVWGYTQLRTDARNVAASAAQAYLNENAPKLISEDLDRRGGPGLTGDYGEAAGKDKASDTSDGGQQAIGDNDGR